MSRFKESSIILGYGLLLYFSVQGVLGMLYELYTYGYLVGLLLLLPATKLLGDLIILAVRSRTHSYWEDWFRETAGFMLFYGAGVLVSAEFWKNFLGLESYPDLTIVVVFCYLLLDWSRKGAKSRGYEHS